jgi:hypothetical protein
LSKSWARKDPCRFDEYEPIAFGRIEPAAQRASVTGCRFRDDAGPGRACTLRCGVAAVVVDDEHLVHMGMGAEIAHDLRDGLFLVVGGDDDGDAVT